MLPSLKTLSIEDKLAGSLHVHNTSSSSILEFLSLRRNKLDGEIPELFKFERLEYLDLGSYNFSGIVDHLCYLSNLWHLDLSGKMYPFQERRMISVIHLC